MRRRRRLLAFWGIIVGLFGFLGGRMWRELRQGQLDHALIAAIKGRDEDLAVKLLAQGADGNAYDAPEENLSFLQHVKRLLLGGQAGKDMHNNPTALALVFETDPWQHGGHGRPGDEEARLVLALLDHGANPDTTDCVEYDLAGCVSSPVLITASHMGYENCVRLLLQHGADVNVRGEDGKTALMVGSDNIEVVQPLLSYHANTELRDENGDTAIHHAVHNFRPWTRAEVIRALLGKGADINATNNDGKTPIMESVEDGDLEVTRLLLSAHARLDLKERKGQTVMDLARLELSDYPIADHDREQLVASLKSAVANRHARK